MILVANELNLLECDVANETTPQQLNPHRDMI